MTRLAWLTDIHLNFLKGPQVYEFLNTLAASDADAFLLGGDIGEASDTAFYLSELAEAVQRPVYFVLGNHDYYRGSITKVRSQMARLAEKSDQLVWLSGSQPVQLDAQTALVGHDGWADGRLGDYARSEVVLNDYVFIEELFECDNVQRLQVLHSLGDESAAHLRQVLPLALAYPRVLVLTHVPPFREACWHEGRISADDWLPHMACAATGTALLEALDPNRWVEALVLCGHTHSGGDVRIRPNLRVMTGAATYGRPAVQGVIELRPDGVRWSPASMSVARDR